MSDPEDTIGKLIAEAEQARRAGQRAAERQERRHFLEATAMSVYASMKADHPAKHGLNEEGLADHAWQSAALFLSRMPPPEEP